MCTTAYISISRGYIEDMDVDILTGLWLAGATLFVDVSARLSELLAGFLVSAAHFGCNKYKESSVSKNIIKAM